MMKKNTRNTSLDFENHARNTRVHKEKATFFCSQAEEAQSQKKRQVSISLSSSYHETYANGRYNHIFACSRGILRLYARLDDRPCRRYRLVGDHLTCAYDCSHRSDDEEEGISNDENRNGGNHDRGKASYTQYVLRRID